MLPHCRNALLHLAVLALASAAVVATETYNAPLPNGVKRLNIPGVQNAFAIGTNLISGGTPATDEGFSALRALGVKTIISVDGAPPDIEAARKNAIRYVHLPCGYDGITTNRQQQLAKAATTLPGPIFVHCHHGAHRGPAAAAIIAMAGQRWTTNTAEAWLHTAGTGTNFHGLYASVRNFRIPPADALKQQPGEFLERAPSAGLVDTMVEIDRRWEILKALFDNASTEIGSREGLASLNHELNLLREHYREAQRLDAAAKHGLPFLNRLRQAENNAQLTADRLERNAGHAERVRALDMLRADCTECHQRHRD